MADESLFKGGRLGPFHLGRRYKHKELGAGLGRLYEAHNVHTGASALVLMPDRHADWEPTEDWRISASSQVSPPYVALEVGHAPASGRLPALSELLDLLASAVERVEQNAEARAHLTREPIGRLRRWLGRSRRWLRSWRGRTLAGLATVALGVGLWLGLTGLDNGPGPGARTAHGVAAEAAARLDAPSVTDKQDPSLAAIAYPMPGGPFRNQAKAPCRPKEGEVEINGGCWVALEKRPPCFETQAEYQGKCYLPVSAATRKAQSLLP
ncbi:hypothetical protein ATI61_109418 [Archangium gephyra]|uniref:Phage protein n=1 Tax=Archangium gephyra TaxID=48 RepID=A0AAC8Q1R5_9BACT|nr:hypothetical protein [Archangium gephyra]AKI99379.1 Phage protein [Archangium gephyra]REG28074.1 hypothetical protein ATI61_109418 [Archangium gephyra]